MFTRLKSPGILSFLLGSFFLIAIVLSLIIYHTDTALFLQINSSHHTTADWIFTHFTHVGDGLFYVVAILISALISKRWLLTALLAFIFSSLLSIFCKEVLFHGTPRPKLYFEQAGTPIRLIEGVQVHSLNSFPSGHTITAFSVFLLTALYTKSIVGGLLSLFLALMAGFSRVYIAQHFPIDVLAGAVLGIFSTLIVLELMHFLVHSFPRIAWDNTFWKQK